MSLLDDMKAAVELKRSLNRARADHQAQVHSMIPQEMREALDVVNAGYSTIYSDIEAEIARLEARIKTDIVRQEGTEKIAGLQAVYVKPSTKWDDAGLTQVLVGLIAFAANIKDSLADIDWTYDVFPQVVSKVDTLHSGASRLAEKLAACRKMGEPSARIAYKLEE